MPIEELSEIFNAHPPRTGLNRCRCRWDRFRRYIPMRLEAWILRWGACGGSVGKLMAKIPAAVQPRVTRARLAPSIAKKAKRPLKGGAAGPRDQTWLSAFQARSDLASYGDNALGLFALAIRFHIDDLDGVAASSITDGNDDKKCDILYVDKDNAVAVIAQCYQASTYKSEAPANKASDLNTAISWILQRPLDQLPARLRPAATELRSAIDAGQISELNIWYIHNCDESKNVKQELHTTQHTALSILKNHFEKAPVTVRTLEVGSGTFSQWYKETQSPILVEKEFMIRVKTLLQADGPEWDAVVAAIPAKFVRDVYKAHKTDIFSANVRDYLGSRSTDSNINNGIKVTAETKPENFWVFNNGITILCHDFAAKKTKTGFTLSVRGLSIVNGAQTTGALGSLEGQLSPAARVLARFVKTSNPDIVQDIVRFNNSQNKVTASDFRSTDAIQRRIKDEMSLIPEAEYEGGRRGGYGDTIKRRPNLLPSYTVGQALAAFHSDPVAAYNQKSEIWINDRLYSRFFSADTTASHIVFAFSLLKCIEHIKLSLVQKSKEGVLTSLEEEQLAFFRQRGAIYLVVSAIAACIETFIGRRIANLFHTKFKKNLSPEGGRRAWLPVVQAVTPLCNQLGDALADGLKNASSVASAVGKFKQLVAATATGNAAIYDAFERSVQTEP